MTIATYGIKQNLPISDNIFPQVKNKQKPNQTKNTKKSQQNKKQVAFVHMNLTTEEKKQ